MAESLTRREFAGLVAAGSVLSGTTVLAAEPAKAEKKDAERKADEPKEPAATPVELIIDLVKQQFPHECLDDMALEEVRIDIGQHLNRSKVLSRFPLTNAHEPGFVFSAWRADLASS